jgi:hypothetical protein
MGRTALTAASLCVFLTLGTSGFFAADALRATAFGAAFFALTGAFGLVAVFLAPLVFDTAFAAALRAAGLAAVARLAVALTADFAAAGFALTARFAVFAAGRFAFERVGDRRKPFVRLLLMGGISKGCSPLSEQPLESPAAYHSFAPKSTNTSICGCFNLQKPSLFTKYTNKEKHLKVIVGYVKVRLAYRGLNRLSAWPQPN